MPVAQCAKLFEFAPMDEVPGRIIRIHQHEGARPRGNRLFQSVKIEIPAVVVEQAVVPHGHGFERGQIFEQWIRRPGHQNFVAGVAQQLEDPGIRFAGAGRQDDTIHRRLVSFRDLLPRGRQTKGLRFVAHRALVRQSVDKRRIYDAGPGGIRFRQVQNRNPGRAFRGEDFRQFVRVRLARKPFREPHSATKSPDGIRLCSGGCPLY